MYDIAIESKIEKTMNSESKPIKCPECKSTRVNKNGHKAGKQNVRIQVERRGMREGIANSQEWAEIASRKKAIAERA